METAVHFFREGGTMALTIPTRCTCGKWYSFFVPDVRLIDVSGSQGDERLAEAVVWPDGESGQGERRERLREEGVRQGSTFVDCGELRSFVSENCGEEIGVARLCSPEAGSEFGSWSSRVNLRTSRRRVPLADHNHFG